MIFVLAGIVVLVVSFGIAFASLVREQTKYEKRIKFDDEAKSLPQDEEDEGLRQKSANKADDKVLREEQVDDSVIQHDPFPWEDPQATLKAKENQGDRTIEEIQAELAQMARKRSGDVQARILEEEEDDDDDKATKGRLSGEISLSNFRKQNN